MQIRVKLKKNGIIEESRLFTKQEHERGETFKWANQFIGLGYEVCISIAKRLKV